MPSITEEQAKVDYSDLRRRYGEPNANIVLNPRAFDVFTTSSRDSVKVSEDALTFSRTDTWLLGRKAGDFLYCSRECGGTSFVRGIRSITVDGGSVVVSTYPGLITDVVQYGWLHAEQPLEVYDSEGGGTGGEQASGTQEKKEGIGEKSMGLQFSGTVSAKATMTARVIVDLVIAGPQIVNWSVRMPYIDLFRIQIVGGPMLNLNINELKAEGSASYSVQLLPDRAKGPFKLGAIWIGPVAIIPSVEFSLPVGATAFGSIMINGSASYGVTYSATLQYTDAAKWSFVPPTPTYTKTANFSVEAEAGFKVAVSPTITFNFLVYGAAGPYIDIGAEVGLRGSVKAVLGKPCQTEIKADAYVNASGAIGAKLCVPLTSECVPKVPKTYQIFATKDWIIGGPWQFPIDKVLPGCTPPDASTPACPTGQTACRAGCKSLQTDSRNCGSCGKVCTVSTGYATSTCSAGKCSCKCADGSACPGASVSTCACAAGQTKCSSGCINTQTDRNNCGACATSCVGTTGDANSICSAGKCSCKCTDGSTCPDGKTTSSCPKPCLCQDGTMCPSNNPNNCPCDAPLKNCSGACIDPLSDADNCGGCKVKCLIQSGGDANSQCVGGRCTCACADGSNCPSNDHAKCCDVSTTICNGQCTDLNNDLYNCGQCARECGPYTGEFDSQCVNGTCSCFCYKDGRACPDGKWWSCGE
jgi:hypothetical protein